MNREVGAWVGQLRLTNIIIKRVRRREAAEEEVELGSRFDSCCHKQDASMTLALTRSRCGLVCKRQVCNIGGYLDPTHIFSWGFHTTLDYWASANYADRKTAR